MAEIKYIRLARGAWTIATTRASLWLGPDHLLYVESNGYAETYKRFYFRDIQSIAFHRTTRVKSVNIFLGAVTLLFAFFGLLVARVPAAKITLLIFGGFFGLLLLINALRGASCKCFIKTAVQTGELSAPARLPAAHNVLERLRPLIAGAQGGEVATENLPYLLREMAELSRAPSPPTTMAANDPFLPPRLES